MPAFVIRLFPIWALLFGALALWQPGLFTPLKAVIIPLLMLIMFGKGMTLRDFARHAERRPCRSPGTEILPGQRRTGGPAGCPVQDLA